MSEDTKKKIREECNITLPHFQVVMGELRKSKFIDNNSINIRTNKDIKITFENKYNFIFSITRQNDEFITKTKQK